MSTHDDRIRRIRRQLVRFQKVVESLRAAGTLREAEQVLKEMVEAAKGKTPEELEQVVIIYSESLAYSLEEGGLSADLASWLSERVRENLMDALKGGDPVNFEFMLDRAVKDWSIQLNRVKNDEALLSKRLRGFLRLAGAGGAFVFDSAKMMTVVPVPTFLTASFIGGAMIFYQGLDQILEPGP